ncbi:MAG TPA: hypothetical protein VMR43_14490 [Variovorax sp.]|nr:hypothetical protein [Variovorax sp.]
MARLSHGELVDVREHATTATLFEWRGDWHWPVLNRVFGMEDLDGDFGQADVAILLEAYEARTVIVNQRAMAAGSERYRHDMTDSRLDAYA